MDAALSVRRLTVGPAAENCYIAWREGASSALVIDPGDEGKRIRALLDSLSLSPGAVLLTHGHFDHTGGLDAFLDTPRYLHEEDLPMLNDPRLNASFLAGDERPRPEDALPVREGDMLHLCGLNVSVLHTPGHTRGSVCYSVEDQALFTGDTLFRGSWGRTDLYGGDSTQMAQSLRRLLTFSRDLPVYPGHGPKTTLFSERGLLWNF